MAVARGRWGCGAARAPAGSVPERHRERCGRSGAALGPVVAVSNHAQAHPGRDGRLRRAVPAREGMVPGLPPPGASRIPRAAQTMSARPGPARER